MPVTQLPLPSLDDLRSQFAHSAPEPEAPAAPAPQTEAPKASFRRGKQAAAQAEPKPEKQARPNAYPGDCRNCGGHVAAGEGNLGPRVAGRWTVEHIVCPTRTQALQDARDAREAKDGEHPIDLDPRNPAPGIYTVEDAEGHVTLWVWQQQMDDDFAPGELIVKFFFGRDNTDRDAYKGFGFIKGGKLQVWKKHRVESGPEKRYVQAARVLLENPSAVLIAKHCPRCNAILSNPASIDAGIGPDCRKAWGW